MRILLEDAIGCIIEGLHEIFPEARQLEIDSETTLGEMPEWDSMAAVNLQTYLLQYLEIEVPLELLADETMLGEIADYLKNPIGSEVI